MKPNTLEFRETSNNTWVMRITADRRIEVNEDVDVTEAAKLVLASMQSLLTPQRKPLPIERHHRNVGVRIGSTLYPVSVVRAIEAAHNIKE